MRPARTKPSSIVRHDSILFIIGAIHRTLPNWLPAKATDSPAAPVLLLVRIVLEPMSYQDHKIIEVNFAVTIYIACDNGFADRLAEV